MKHQSGFVTLLIVLCTLANGFAQTGHALQTDDGSNHYTIIKGSATGGVYTVPPNGGTLVSSSTLSFADFYAMMPGDNAAPIAPGAAVLFPQNGSADGSGAISRVSNSQFNLSAIGTYEIFFDVSISEPGQLMLRLNGAPIASSVAGRATGTSQITATCLVTTAVSNSVLEVINPAGNPVALTITPLAGGTQPVSAHLVIRRLQ